ncbi:glutamine amidotransferase [Leifsonia sp. TF02-11]|uniref:glutamine amidotransferase n=1 Tax=Leifsonia sp. TF02-11 TaxID=2815212 RepID=UPI001AA18F5E|nr:glutamine amidotransferase [Leifsonia sp. TF02-11]MBO1741276.1 cytoplasmic protein [Leifsonia sp. TF02-11]
MTKALLLGESWTTHMIHQKGFDSFTTTEYVEGGHQFAGALRSGGWEVDYLPAHTIESAFPTDPAWIRQYDLVIISDVGANSFLLTRSVFNRSQAEPNRLEIIRDHVLAGAGLLMVGGYLSFAGIDAKARYADSPLAALLPVEVLRHDDREEHPEGVVPAVVDAAHAALGGVGSDWPALLGYNRTVAKPGSIVPATIGDDPLVALGTAGAGRAGVFTSDMSPHWAPPQFMEWAGYAPLWQGLAGWLARK